MHIFPKSRALSKIKRHLVQTLKCLHMLIMSSSSTIENLERLGNIFVKILMAKHGMCFSSCKNETISKSEKDMKTDDLHRNISQALVLGPIDDIDKV